MKTMFVLASTLVALAMSQGAQAANRSDCMDALDSMLQLQKQIGQYENMIEGLKSVDYVYNLHMKELTAAQAEARSAYRAFRKNCIISN